jgi:hypothetical protein
MDAGRLRSLSVAASLNQTHKEKRTRTHQWSRLVQTQRCLFVPM